MAKELWNGKMDINMKEIGLMIRCRGKEFIYIMINITIWENFIKVINLDRV